MSLSAVMRVSKNTGALFLGRVSAMLFSFAFIVYIARFLGVAGFGQYALAQRYFDLFLSLSATAVSTLLIREVAKQPAALNRQLSVSLVMVSALTGAACTILLVLVAAFNYAAETQAAIHLVALALIPGALGVVVEAVFVALEKAEYVTYGTIVESLLRTGLGLLALYLGYGVLALFVVLIIARLCLLLFYGAFLSKRVASLRWELTWPALKQQVRDWRVFALENWLSSVYGSLDVILLSLFYGEFAVGVYTAAAKLLRLGAIVAASYTTAIFPYLSRLFVEAQETLRQLNTWSLQYTLAFVLPVIVTVSILADRLILLLYTEAYAGAIPVLRILIWFLLLEFFNPYLSHSLFARGEQRKSLQVAIIKLTCFIALGFWLIPRGGAGGTAWTVLLADAVAFGCYFLFVFWGQGVITTLAVMGRVVVAATLFAAFLLLLRDVQLILLLSTGGVLYFLLLFSLRVLSLPDLKLLQRLK